MYIYISEYSEENQRWWAIHYVPHYHFLTLTSQLLGGWRHDFNELAPSWFQLQVAWT